MANGYESSSRLRHQRGGGGIMIWVRIIDNIMFRPWTVFEGIQITAETNIRFLKEHLQPWFKRQRITFRTTMIFMKDNATYRSAKKTRLMKQPACSLDLNPNENLWSVFMRQV